MKPKYLALSPRFLSRLSYHFIWGLGLDRKGYKSFFEIAQELHGNNNKRQEILDKVNNILTKTGILGFLIRYFYWAFNINNYCQDYYQLQAYYSWRLYEEGITMFSERQRTLIDEQNGFISGRQIPEESILSKTYNVATNTIVTSLQWTFIKPIKLIGGGIIDLFSKDKSDDSPLENLDADKTHFYVSTLAKKYLDILEITDAEQSFPYEIAAVKSQYRKLCLKHHPDKGGNIEMFTKIDDAYKNLLNHILPNKNLLGLDERYAEHFAQRKREHESVEHTIKLAKEAISASDKSMSESKKTIASAEKLLEEFLEEERLENENISNKSTQPTSSSMFDNVCNMFFSKKTDAQDGSHCASHNNSYNPEI